MIDWKKRGAKIVASFFTGYSGGWTAVMSSNLILSPGDIEWGWIFILPMMAGLTTTWPQLAKVFNEIANS